MAIADKEAFSWFTGKRELLDARRINRLHSLMWIGLLGMIATGLYMAWPAREFLLREPLFLTKLAFVVALFINGFIIGKLNNIPSHKAFASLSREERLPLFISGGVSLFSWMGAIIVAFVLFGWPF